MFEEGVSFMGATLAAVTVTVQVASVSSAVSLLIVEVSVL